MNKSKHGWKIILASLISISWAAALATAAPGPEPRAPDNSGINARDTKGGPVTPEDQSNDPADIQLTQKIRQAITDDKTLSVNAKNIKVITIKGVVTLRGPVQNDGEKARIGSTAIQVAGEANVKNQLEVIGAK